MSSERTQVRHRLSDAEQSSVIPAVRRPEQSARTFLPSTTVALGVPKEQRDYLGGWSRSSVDLESLETRHQCQAEFVRRPFRRGGHRLATGRPPSPKRLLSGRQSKVLQRPRKYDPAATTAGTRGTEVEEGEQSKAPDVEPEPEGHCEAQAKSEVKKDRRLKSENTKSKSLWSNPEATRELTRAQLQKGSYRPERYKSTPQVGSLLHGTRHRLTSTWVP